MLAAAVVVSVEVLARCEEIGRLSLVIVDRRIAELEAIRHELSSLVAGQSSECSDELCLCNVTTSA